jgi:hypothetical protein
MTQIDKPASQPASQPARNTVDEALARLNRKVEQSPLPLARKYSSIEASYAVDTFKELHKRGTLEVYEEALWCAFQAFEEERFFEKIDTFMYYLHKFKPSSNKTLWDNFDKVLEHFSVFDKTSVLGEDVIEKTVFFRDHFCEIVALCESNPQPIEAIDRYLDEKAFNYFIARTGTDSAFFQTPSTQEGSENPASGPAPRP